jgi:hypothetical protein
MNNFKETQCSLDETGPATTSKQVTTGIVFYQMTYQMTFINNAIF